jgi:hypothetical protein
MRSDFTALCNGWRCDTNEELAIRIQSIVAWLETNTLQPDETEEYNDMLSVFLNRV